MLLLALLGCRPVDPLPEDLDGVVHWLWVHMEDGTDEEILEGVIQLDAALGGARLDGPTDGAVTRLDATEVEPLGITDRDPADAAGIFLGNLVRCPLGTVAEIVTDPDQEELYPGVYDAYERTYHGDVAAFLDGDPDALRWSIDYEASVLGSSYTGHTEALLRRVAVGGDDLPFREAYLARFFAPEPAVFEEGSQKTFEQDYQLEVYWSRRRGETLHAYAMWRQANWGAGFTSEDETVQRLLLGGMEDWDRDTERICADGGP